MTSSLEIRRARPGDEKAIARVHVASWRTTYAGLIDPSVLASLSEQKRADWIAQVIPDPQFGLFVALRGEEIVGFALGGAERVPSSGYDSEILAIYCLQEAQTQGAGRALQQAVMEHLRSQGMRRMRVWVLEGNPACGFYERMGGKLLPETKLERIYNRDYPHRSYGWDLSKPSA